MGWSGYSISPFSPVQRPREIPCLSFTFTSNRWICFPRRNCTSMSNRKKANWKCRNCKPSSIQKNRSKKPSLKCLFHRSWTECRLISCKETTRNTTLTNQCLCTPLNHCLSRNKISNQWLWSFPGKVWRKRATVTPVNRMWLPLNT